MFIFLPFAFSVAFNAMLFPVEFYFISSLFPSIYMLFPFYCMLSSKIVFLFNVVSFYLNFSPLYYYYYYFNLGLCCFFFCLKLESEKDMLHKFCLKSTHCRIQNAPEQKQGEALKGFCVSCLFRIILFSKFSFLYIGISHSTNKGFFLAFRGTHNNTNTYCCFYICI